MSLTYYSSTQVPSTGKIDLQTVGFAIFSAVDFTPENPIPVSVAESKHCYNEC